MSSASEPLSYIVLTVASILATFAIYLFQRIERKRTAREKVQERRYRNLAKKINREARRRRQTESLVKEIAMGYKSTTGAVKKLANEAEDLGEIITEVSTQTRVLQTQMEAFDKWKETMDRQWRSGNAIRD